ncbi:alpha/beta fold hydrolase [Hellea balneolensis]|uniref:alpha/beta fold hydrolase n=1 Tax=Hellea balneolensis TaxID=287478 RepID=UPI000415535D|nr:alpha/beta hydrolase [Hellea balneolensis]
MHSAVTLNYLSAEDGEKIAYKMSERADGYKGPTLIWCGGLKSDMEGGKAVHLHDWAIEEGRHYIRFDYFGHGVSSGEFRDGTISRWAADVVRVIDELAIGDVILVGSSMGGWASLLAALNRPDRVKGLLLIAPAPDFTEKLTYAQWSQEQRETLERDGIVYVPSDYDEPNEYSRVLMEDGKAHQILDAPIKFDGPVRILQGAADPVVPWEYSRRILDVITSHDVDYTLVKNGDHSLSSPNDLDRLVRTAKELCRTLTPS